MQKQMALALRREAENVAQMFSRTDRGANYDNETFSVEDITITSEITAAVTFSKEPTGKKAVAWFYHINSRRKPRWEYFFVTYSHLVGMNRVSKILHDIEQHNFGIATREESA
jgi:hypothetical protein